MISSIAGTLTAKKLGVKVAHLEARLSTFDMSIPEEINGKVKDANFDLFLVTDESGVHNLRTEGVAEEKIHFVGNVMINTSMTNLKRIDSGESMRRRSLYSATATGSRSLIQSLTWTCSMLSGARLSCMRTQVDCRKRQQSSVFRASKFRKTPSIM